LDGDDGNLFNQRGSKSSNVRNTIEERAAPRPIGSDNPDVERPAPPPIPNNNLPPDDRRVSVVVQYAELDVERQEPDEAHLDREPPSAPRTRSPSPNRSPVISEAGLEPYDPNSQIINAPIGVGLPADLVVADNEGENGNLSRSQSGHLEPGRPTSLLPDGFRGESEHIEDAPADDAEVSESTDGSIATEGYVSPEDDSGPALEPLARIPSRKLKMTRSPEEHDPMIESSSQAQRRARLLSPITEEPGSYMKRGISVDTGSNNTRVATERSSSRGANQAHKAPTNPSSYTQTVSRALPDLPYQAPRTLPYNAPRATYIPERRSSLRSSSGASDTPAESEDINHTEPSDPPNRQVLIENPIERPRNAVRLTAVSRSLLEQQAPDLIPEDLYVEEPNSEDALKLTEAVFGVIKQQKRKQAPKAPLLRTNSEVGAASSSSRFVEALSSSGDGVASSSSRVGAAASSSRFGKALPSSIEELPPSIEAFPSSRVGEASSSRVGEASSSRVGQATSSMARAYEIEDLFPDAQPSSQGIARTRTASSEALPRNDHIQQTGGRRDPSPPPAYNSGDFSSRGVVCSSRELNPNPDGYDSEAEDDDPPNVFYAQFELPQIPLHELGLNFNGGDIFCQTRLPFSFDSEISPPRLNRFERSEETVLEPFSSVVFNSLDTLCNSDCQGSEHSQSSGSCSSSGYSSRSSSLSGSSREFVPLAKRVEIEYQEVPSFMTKISQSKPISPWMEHVEYFDGSDSSESQISSPSFSEVGTSPVADREWQTPGYFDRQSPDSSLPSTPIWTSPLSTPEGCTSGSTQAGFPFPDSSPKVIPSAKKSPQHLYQQWASEHLQEQEKKRKSFRAKMQDIRELYLAFLKADKLEDLAGSDGSYSGRDNGSGEEFDGPGTDEDWTDDEFFYFEPPPRKPAPNKPGPKRPPPKGPQPKK
jgi:hypothetical protein